MDALTLPRFLSPMFTVSTVWNTGETVDINTSSFTFVGHPTSIPVNCCTSYQWNWSIQQWGFSVWIWINSFLAKGEISSLWNTIRSEKSCFILRLTPLAFQLYSSTCQSQKYDAHIPLAAVYPGEYPFIISFSLLVIVKILNRYIILLTCTHLYHF